MDFTAGFVVRPRCGPLARTGRAAAEKIDARPAPAGRGDAEGQGELSIGRNAFYHYFPKERIREFEGWSQGRQQFMSKQSPLASALFSVEFANTDLARLDGADGCMAT